MQLSEKEQQAMHRYAAFLHNNDISDAFLVSIMKLTLKRLCAGSASYLASKYQLSTQYVNRKCNKLRVCGLTIYTRAF
jgi:hypothetical protein